MSTESQTETLALRTALRELVALSTIPAVWIGKETPVIAAGLADALIGSLQLDFIFVRLCDPKGGAAIELTRGHAWEAFPEWLATHLGHASPFSCNEIVLDVGDAEPRRGVALPIGVNAEGGVVAAACRRADFPSQIDQLLLSMAANRAATAFQSAYLSSELDAKVAELSRARNELEMKVAERTGDLQRSEAYLAEAQRFTHTGSWACDIFKREMRHSSEEHSRLYGFDPDRGLPSLEEFHQRIHPEDRAGVTETLERAGRAAIDWEGHFRVVLPDGTTKYMHSIGHPVLNASGDVVEYVGILMDVTERRRADEERERLRQVQADLAHVIRVTTLSELTASLAHEIKQPISAAVTDAKTCLRWLGRDNPDVAEASEAAARLVKDVTRAADIISRISGLFKKGPPRRELVDVNELVREMIVLLRNEAHRHSIAICIELAEDLPKVMADRVQLQQVFMNLMLNGIEAMKETGEGRELTIKSEACDAQLLFSVSDTGVGLPPDQADQIFRAFFTTKDNGTGMGLPVSRSIIESHGGRLWATGAPGGGATFRFTLPATAAAHA